MTTLKVTTPWSQITHHLYRLKGFWIFYSKFTPGPACECEKHQLGNESRPTISCQMHFSCAGVERRGLDKTGMVFGLQVPLGEGRPYVSTLGQQVSHTQHFLQSAELEPGYPNHPFGIT